MSEEIENKMTEEIESAASAVAPAKNPAGKKKKSAYRRMIEHRLKIAGIIVGSIALLLILFFTFIASYDFSEKAWHVKFDPIHGYKYTLYTKQGYNPARIVIESSSKSSSEVTVPDTIWGVRVEELSDGAFKDSVKTIRLGKFVNLVGEGYQDKTLILPEGYGSTSYYTAFKDKNASGFYYKAMPDGTLTAFAFFGSESTYAVPSSFAGLPVSKVTEFYETDDYLTRLADCEAEHYSVLPYNMIRVNAIRNQAIDPYVYFLEDLESREKMKERIMSLPSQYAYNSDGSPADGETAIKLALIHKGDGNGKNCGGVMADYDPLDFIAAERYLTKRTTDCHTDGEPDFGDWLMDGFVEL